MAGTTTRQAAHEPRPDPRQLKSIDAIADRLGVNVRHVRRLVNEKRIPFIKWGHLLRFDLEEIEQWIDDKRRPTAALRCGAEAAIQVPGGFTCSLRVVTR